MARPVTLKHLILFTLHSMRESASAGAPWEKNRGFTQLCVPSGRVCLREVLTPFWDHYRAHRGKSDKDTLVWDSLVPVRQISTFAHSAVVSERTSVEGQLDAQLGNWFFSVKTNVISATDSPVKAIHPLPPNNNNNNTCIPRPQIRHVQNRVFPIYFCIKKVQFTLLL